MKLLKRITIIIALFFLTLGAVAFLLPRHWTCEREIVIAAPPAEIHAWVGDLANWSAWTPWNRDQDESMEWTLTERTTGEGATIAWTADKLGNGVLRVRGSSLEKGLEYEIDFEDGGAIFTGSIRCVAADDGTRVVWTNGGDLGYRPDARYIGLLMDSWIGPDLEAGLDQLRDHFERESPSPREG